MTAIDQIKQELRDIIELSDKATPGEWTSREKFKHSFELLEPRVWLGASSSLPTGQQEHNASFIAASRNLTPKMARALLTTIDAIETALHYAHFVEKQDYEELAKSLETIRREWGGQA